MPIKIIHDPADAKVEYAAYNPPDTGVFLC